MKISNEKRKRFFSHALIIVFFLNFLGLVILLSTHLFSDNIKFKYFIVSFFVITQAMVITVLYYIRYIKIEIKEGIIIIRYTHPLLLEDRHPEFEIPVYRIENFEIDNNQLSLYIGVKRKKFSIKGLDRESIKKLEKSLQKVINN